MKKFVLFYLLIIHFGVFSQNLTAKAKFVSTVENFNFEIKNDSLKFVSMIENPNYESFLKSNVKINYNELKAQFDKFKFQPIEKKIDYNRLVFKCGIPQTIESKDLMISAFKYYILNKYVFSLFSKTEYN